MKKFSYCFRNECVGKSPKKCRQLQAELQQVKEENRQQADFLSLAKEEMDALQKQVETERWIPVSERLPEIIEDSVSCFSEDVLVLTANKSWLKACCVRGKGWQLRYIRYSKRQIAKLKITHWKPIILPEQGRNDPKEKSI